MDSGRNHFLYDREDEIMLQINHLSIIHRADDRKLIEDLSFSMEQGEKIALIGEEGNGKSTLLKWIADPALIGDYADAEGERIIRGEEIGYLPQALPENQRTKSVYTYFLEEDSFSGMTAHELGSLADQMKVDASFFYREERMEDLSGGERIKAQMGRILMAHPTLLLLDEPSNDLDLEMLQWMRRLIREPGRSVIFISHDEGLLKDAADRIIHIEQLHRKMLPRVTVSGVPYQEYLADRERSFQHQEQMAISDRRQQRIRMDKYRRIEQSVDYALNHVSRQDPHSGQLLKKKMKSVKAMGRRFEREDKSMTAMPEKEEAILLRFNEGISIPAGKHILDLQLPELRTPDGAQVLCRNVQLQVVGNEHVCIVGRNGVGKSTLLRQIAGILLQRSDIHAAYMPQDYRELLGMDLLPLDFLTMEQEQTKDSLTRAGLYLGAMKYTSDEMRHSVRDLSGGQQAKLLLLKMNLDRADVLILDEPTRNFSPLSAPEVRSVLQDFRGTIISVSHDRKYIHEVCSRAVELTEDGIREMNRNG
jgi:ATPase subunit of ABC transporter with duplicated ATPase domains